MKPENLEEYGLKKKVKTASRETHLKNATRDIDRSS
jgi:hypothetical protein